MQPKTQRSKSAGARLFINTTVMNEITVAIVMDGGVECLKQPIELDQRDDLLKYINQLVKRSKTALDRLESITVVRGPGPFTAVRVGVAVANALGLALNIPVYGIKNTECDDIVLLIDKAQSATQNTPVRPYYDRPPNITKPKRKN
jgi:tRNA threonylcarbamoyl adenosine modification protein YeaZ